MAAVEPAGRAGPQASHPNKEEKLTNGFPSGASPAELKQKMSAGGGPEAPAPSNGGPRDSNGGYMGGPGGPAQFPGGYPGYQGYGQYPPKGPPGQYGGPPGGYPGGPGGHTPTLNSLLQDRSGYGAGGGGAPPGGPQGPYGGGPPGEHPGYPGFPGYQGGYRPQGPPRAPYGGGYGYPGYPGAGQQRYPPGDPRDPHGQGGPRPGFPPQAYGPPRPQAPPANGPPRPSNNGAPAPGPEAPKAPQGPESEVPEGGPPPPPSKHEGPPSATWTPPVNAQKGPAGAQHPPGTPDTEGSDDGRPESREEGGPPVSAPPSRPSPSPRPRPSPSPTGSSSSRSMSPAISQPRDGSLPMPPRPASGASEGNGPTMNSSMGGAAPGGPQGYPGQPQMGPPPHMYKPGHPGAPGGPQGVPPYGHGYPGGYPGQRPGYPPHQGYPPQGYPPQGYGPRPGYPPQQAGYPPQGWGPNGAGPRPGGPPQGPPGHPQQHPGMRMGGPPGPGYGPPGQKMPAGYPPSGYGYPPSSNGPHMGPPTGPPGQGYPPGHPQGPGYPPGGPGKPQGYPSPSSTPNSMPPASTPTPIDGGAPPSDSTPGAGTATTNSVSGPMVTTGPDGQPMHDETSQQSTLSQSSDNSGGRQTPKGSYPQGYAHAPGTPHSGQPSPGSMGSSQDEVPGGSPHWGRVPASPLGANPQAKVENLQRLYEIDDHPERRQWLDKLLSFMEERGTPISQCPTISKNPLDLYRLYMFTKDRGGFVECTNKKAWKDIAAQLGIGPSSSGAYTLKKHYGKNLLPFECHFERGGVDPAPILAQVEAQSKKKGKGSGPRPLSPGSQDDCQDSRDSFTGNSQDGYPGYGAQYNNYPPGQGPGDGRPPQQHPGMGPGGNFPPNYPQGGGPPGGYPPSSQPGYPGYPGGAGGPPQQYPGYQNSGGPPGGDPYNRGGYPGYPPRPGYPGQPGGPPTSAGTPPPTGAYPPSSQPYEQYQKGPHGAPGNGPSPGPPNPGPPMGGLPQNPRMMMRPQHMQGPGTQHPVILRANSPATPGTIQDTLPPALPVQRIPNPHGYSGGSSGPGGGPGMPPPGSMYSGGPGGPPGSKPPGAPGAPPSSGPPGGPHPGQRPPAGYPGPYGGPPGPRPPGPGPMYPGSPGSWGRPSGYSGPGPSYGPGPPGGPQGVPRPGGPPGPGFGYPYGRPQGMPSYDSRGPQGPPRPGQPGPPQGYRQQQGPPGRQMPPGRRELYNFPPDSLECTQPLLQRRKKLTKLDAQPVEGWRLVMALRSGLLMETTWALDTLNILLYDDNSVAYFGLGNMPGLLEALIEHWRASLIAVFGVGRDLELGNTKTDAIRKRKRDKQDNSTKGLRWYDRRPEVVEDETGLGVPDAELLRRGDKVRILHHQPKDFTQEARFTEKEFEFDDCKDALFVSDDDRSWDGLGAGFECGEDLWAAGGGEDTSHIHPADTLDRRVQPFVRVLKDVCRDPSTPRKASKDSESAVSPGKKSKRRVLEGWVIPTKEKTEKDKVEGKQCDKNSTPATVIKEEKEAPLSAVKTEKEEGEKETEKEAEKEEEKDPLEVIRERTGIIVTPHKGLESRWSTVVLEEENFQPDCASLNLVQECQDNLGKRAVVVSTIFRNLSFVPGNETTLSSSPGFLAVCGKILLHHHWHPPRTSKQRNYDRGEEEDFTESCTSLGDQPEWWWEHLQVIRENVMVALANIAGHTDLTDQPECLVRPILSGLLEWAVSPSAAAQDPFTTVGPNSPISPQRLAIESLCKLCVQETNVDLLLSTPPFSRIEKLCSFLSKKLYRSEDQVLREFAINLLFYFSAADSGVARTIALQDTTVSLLIGFIEQAESNALIVAQQHGVNALRDNPDSMGTSLDMLRRAANTLNHLARHEDNRPLFVRQEQRLLNLVMSQILDQGVASIISQVLFQVSGGDRSSSDQ